MIFSQGRYRLRDIDGRCAYCKTRRRDEEFIASSGKMRDDFRTDTCGSQPLAFPRRRVYRKQQAIRRFLVDEEVRSRIVQGM